jgi:hypothetical protein
MPRSLAYVAFQPILRTSLELVRIDVRNYHDPPLLSEQDAVRGLRGGSAVLMVAGFETFLDDLITEWVQTLETHAPPVVFSMLPNLLQVENVYKTLDRAMKGPRYQPPVDRFHRLPEIRRAGGLVANELLNPDAFTGTGGNPGKDAVKALFKQVGMSDMFSEAKPRFESKWRANVSTSFIGDKLDEIVQRRHRVAHRADALSISRRDLRDAIRFLRVFSETLDIECGFYFRRLGRTCR